MSSMHKIKRARAKRLKEASLMDMYMDAQEDIEQMLKLGYKTLNALNRAAKKAPATRQLAGQLQTQLRALARLQGEIQTAQHDYDPVRSYR